MITPEPRGHATGELDHSKPEEAEEYDLKFNFMQMIEALKEEIKNFLKEMEEKTNKKVEEMNKSLKKIQEIQEKAIKQGKQTIQIVQDLKTETKAIKKTQTEGILEMENLSKQTGSTEASITNRLQGMKDRISGVKDVIEQLHSSVKENVNFNKSLTQNIQEIWDTMKTPNLRIIGDRRRTPAQRHRKYIQ